MTSNQTKRVCLPRIVGEIVEFKNARGSECTVALRRRDKFNHYVLRVGPYNAGQFQGSAAIHAAIESIWDS